MNSLKTTIESLFDALGGAEPFRLDDHREAVEKALTAAETLAADQRERIEGLEDAEVENALFRRYLAEECGRRLALTDGREPEAAEIEFLPPEELLAAHERIARRLDGRFRLTPVREEAGAEDGRERSGGNVRLFSLR